ncbi:MAG TPA: hypothetical protein VK137_12260, partial [Planctomycetaceae bacterium]|nr:hypothetical protein [Planctomycetaceae bacterium]
MTESRASHLDDSRRVIAWMIAGHVACLAVGLGMLPRWFFSSSTSANMLGASLLVTVVLQSVLLTVGLWRLRVVTRRRQIAAEVVAQRVRDDL